MQTVLEQPAQSSNYFFESVGTEPNSNVPITHELECLKNILSGERRNHRDRSTKKAFLEYIQSHNAELLFNNIDNELKKAKEKNKRIKQESNHKKDEKRKFRKKSDKILTEILKMKQESEKKKADLIRLSSESNALQNQHQKQLNDINTNKKYDISQLIDTVSCKNILNQQQQILQRSNHDIHQQKAMLSTQKSINKQLTQKEDSLKKKNQSYKDMMSNKQNNKENAELIAFKQELESVKKLYGFKKIDIRRNELWIEVEMESKQVYIIQIGMEAEEALNIQITNNNTKFNEIREYILSKYNVWKDNDTLLVNVPCIAIKKMVTEIMLILKKLPQRYRDINALYDIYQQNMLPWIPENSELLFKFSFKQNVNITKNVDDDRKINNDGNVLSILVDIPLVISLSWNYPHCGIVLDGGVISVEHYNCSLGEKYDGVNVSEIEAKWNGVLQDIVNQMKDRFQNDIVSFVNFIHDQLQRFANSNQ